MKNCEHLDAEGNVILARMRGLHEVIQAGEEAKGNKCKEGCAIAELCSGRGLHALIFGQSIEHGGQNLARVKGAPKQKNGGNDVDETGYYMEESLEFVHLLSIYRAAKRVRDMMFAS